MIAYTQTKHHNKDQSAHKKIKIKRQEKEYSKAHRQNRNEACTNLQCQANSPQVIFEMREEEGGTLAKRAY